MHPILFRLPLPNVPLRLWWALVLLALASAVFAVVAHRRGEAQTSYLAGAVVVILGGLGFVFRDVVYEAGALPIYSYGAMLGLSMVIGWFWLLARAARAEIDKETAANTFLIAGAAALVGARLLYALTNWEELGSFSELFNLRAGGYSLYGGFLSGLLVAWWSLRKQPSLLARFADAASAPLALGLALTRVGCYLYGCDFGARLPARAPGWLSRLGEFPHWSGAMQDAGEGAGAYLRQREQLRGTPEGVELLTRNVAYPVHPTQLYEVLLGLALLGLVLWLGTRKLRPGTSFAALVLGYAVGRFSFEFVRDEPGHLGLGFELPLHVSATLGLLVLGGAVALALTRAVPPIPARRLALLAVLLPAVLAFLWLRPAAFTTAEQVAWSASQWVALLTALAAGFWIPRVVVGDAVAART